MPAGYQSEIPEDEIIVDKKESEQKPPVKTNYTTYKPIRMKKLPPVKIVDSEINIEEDITIIADRVILDEPENEVLEEDAIDPAVYDRVIVDEPVAPVAEAKENYLEIGNTLLLARDYSQAVGVFWKAINDDAENAVLWYQLFTTYKLLDEGENAEMTILEAMRLDSKNENYLIDYLKIIRKLHPAPYFMEELVRANKNFPNNPTILLSLAKAFNSIQKKPGTAVLAYKEFLRLYPQHPLRPNVEAAIASLGGR
jgi:tetratricopeptide (TPR) repeat protein